ncbi:uncharacterized protein TRUGW13939_07874 [Talaromyces rugulosus]|uniref:Myocyte-specific enhancer factor 2d n=1 Tax=Talaromyces rugulosus TaxID=121627 RepID=A0A7H8R3Z8_TALRU|nr:uncharacterized protein TRUGW13939_07874 [Talaromyces rugulosus]QKX60728.1 hypothetical protein TRUGW13939_07874 [Talaromyces rugulosus]
MNGREIPGFCWDPEKKKYFRIQANHVAPTGSQYSAQAVKKRKYDSEVQKHREGVERQIRLQRVRKSRHLTNPISRITAEIESDPVRGFVKQSRQGEAFTSQLQLRRGYDLDSLTLDATVADFARHDESGALIVGLNNSRFSCDLIVCPPFAQEEGKEEGKVSSIPSGTDKFVSMHRLSSLSLCDSGAFLATMDSGIEGDSMFLVGSVANVPTDGTPIRASQLPLELTGHDSTMWCSAARPDSGNDPFFAVGTSEGLYTFRQGDMALTRANINLPKRSRKASKDVDLLALDWLSPTVIATGFRNSLVGLYDVRSSGFATRIQHPRSVGQVKRVDENRLVVAGYRSMQMYDIRFPSKRGILSNSCLTFEDYENEFRHQIDVNCGLGLVASINDGERIRFHSLADGSNIPTGRSMERNIAATNRIMFENSQGMSRLGQYPRLLVSKGTVVAELAW